VSEPKGLLSLWMHEAQRVFQDRLINDEDRAWFRRALEEQLQKQCNLTWADVISTDRLIYGDYLVPGAEPKMYQQVSSGRGKVN
jgi:dynein heavy chain